MKPLDLGTLFDTLTEHGVLTTVQLSRPFDIAPDGGTAYGVGRLADLVHDAAGLLAAAGAGPGDRVAVVKRNHWDYVLLAAEAARIGAVPALLCDRLRPETLATLFKRLDPRVAVVGADTVRAAREAGIDLPSFAPRTLSLDGAEPGTVPLAELHGQQPPAPYRRADDRPLIVHHTSGTTGVPKLVVHSTETIIRRLAGFEAHRWPVLATRRTDTVASATVFSHGRAIPWTVSVLWLAPREVVIVADPEPCTAEPTLRAHPPTTLEALPDTYLRWQGLTGGPDNVFRNVRLFVSTLDAVHPPTVRAFLTGSRRRRPIWMQGWGQTETGPLTFRFLTPNALAVPQGRHPTTRDLGRPVPGVTRLRVVDPQTLRRVPAGRPGLIMARSKARCLDYVDEHDRWLAKVHGSWWNTGDIGTLTRDGRLLLLDRAVDAVPEMSCLEIEDVLAERLPDIHECVLLSRPGRTPLPVVLTASGQVPAADVWRTAVSDLPELGSPVGMVADVAPRTGSGKIRRIRLRARFAPDTISSGTGRWT